MNRIMKKIIEQIKEDWKWMVLRYEFSCTGKLVVIEGGKRWTD